MSEMILESVNILNIWMNNMNIHRCQNGRTLVPSGTHVLLQVEHLGLGPVPGGPEAPGLPVPADNVSLGKRPSTTH